MLCGCAVAALGQEPNHSGDFDTAAEAELVQLINQSRAQHGLSQLTVDKRLAQVARKHTELMVEHSALSHQFPGEPPVEVRFSSEGFPSDRQGENVDLDQTIPGAHDALMHSPPHRANILDPNFNVIGVGVMRAGNNLFVTEDFGRRLPQLSEPQAEAAIQAAINQYAKGHGLVVPARKPQPQLRRLACDMALNDALDLAPASRLPGAHEAFAWNAGDPGKLPRGIDHLLGSGLPSGYSLGACFAPSVSHPGGLYWLVMVSY